MFTFRGLLLRTIGSRGTGPLQFIHPRGLLLVPEEVIRAAASDAQVTPQPSDGHYLVVAERSRVQMIFLPAEPQEAMRSVQRIDFEEGSNLLGLCSIGARLLIADVSKDRVAALRLSSTATTVEEQAGKRFELRR